jgi:hypothetical protein
MNCWKIVDAGDFKKYGRNFLIFYTKNLDKFKHCNHFWAQFIPEYYDTYLENDVSFRDGISKFGEINEIAFLTIQGNKTPIHIDHTIGLNKNVKARLNIPLLNCEKSYTAFYDLSPEILANYKITLPGKQYGSYISEGSSKYWEFSNDEIKPFTKVELVQPTILRTSYPHNVICQGDKFPRIAITISFKEDISKYLN